MLQPDLHIIKYDLHAVNTTVGLETLVSYVKDLWIRAMAEITSKRMSNLTAMCQLDTVQFIQLDLQGHRVMVNYLADLVPADLSRNYVAAQVEMKFDIEQNGWFVALTPFTTFDAGKWFNDFCNQIEKTYSSACYRRDGLKVERGEA